MESSHKKISDQDYLKALSDRKGLAAAWPVGADTAQERLVRERFSIQGMSGSLQADFQGLVYAYAATHGRELPWRLPGDPWLVLVSEVMLQQTQVERVIPRFLAFRQRFPDAASLAEATQAELLTYWQGLGYNRRALNLQRAARLVVERYGGALPEDELALQTLPGVGPYTAGAIRAFAFNRPAVFLETNIRAVLLHLFCSGREAVHDRELLELAGQTLDRERPRDWYNALMDYGSDMKRRFPNPSRRSRHHNVQGRFEGSDRQIRGAIIRHIVAQGMLTETELFGLIGGEPQQLRTQLAALIEEGFVVRQGRRIRIA